MTLKALPLSQALQDLWPMEAHAEDVPRERQERAEEAPQSPKPGVFICPGDIQVPLR